MARASRRSRRISGEQYDNLVSAQEFAARLLQPVNHMLVVHWENALDGDADEAAEVPPHPLDRRYAYALAEYERPGASSLWMPPETPDETRRKAAELAAGSGAVDDDDDDGNSADDGGDDPLLSDDTAEQLLAAGDLLGVATALTARLRETYAMDGQPEYPSEAMDIRLAAALVEGLARDVGGEWTGHASVRLLPGLLGADPHAAICDRVESLRGQMEATDAPAPRLVAEYEAACDALIDASPATLRTVRLLLGLSDHDAVQPVDLVKILKAALGVPVAESE
jgi:hypothetical protein